MYELSSSLQTESTRKGLLIGRCDELIAEKHDSVLDDSFTQLGDGGIIKRVADVQSMNDCTWNSIGIGFRRSEISRTERSGERLHGEAGA